MAYADGGFHALAALAALLGAVLIQIGTNFSNDYVDFLKGADTDARKGPMRATQAGLVAPETMKRATILAFGLAFAVGLYLVWRGGWPVLAIGIASIAAGIAYTAGRHALAYLGLGDVFVLLFFGPVAVGGTYYVQTLTITPVALVAGLGPGLLSAALLVVNNLRDVDEDRAADKRTLIVRFGTRFGAALYAFTILGAALVPVVLWAWTGAHAPAMAASVVAVLGWPGIRTAWRTNAADALNPLLGTMGKLLFVYSVLFAVGWVL